MICNRCNNDYPLTLEFYPIDKRIKRGFRPYCKECDKKVQKNWRLKNKNYYYKRINYYKSYYNKKEIKDKRKQYLKEYFKNNKEKLMLKNKEYAIKNKINILKNKRIYEKKRRKIDINYKIKQNLRGRLYKAVRDLGISKQSTLNLLGCSIENFKIWISSQFKDNMTWVNYGLWEIDHIIPCSLFDLRNSEEQEICFHYTNLQPLWKYENNAKGYKNDTWYL